MLGLIELIPVNLRPKKVWKHLFDAAEHWERICDSDVSALRAKTEAVVGLRRERNTELPRLPSTSWRKGRALLVRHHDETYAPVYRNEMASPETNWAPKPGTSRRYLVLTPRSVFIVVQLGQPSWVITAYRPHQPTQGVCWDEFDFRRHAQWHFRKETNMNIENLAPVVAENLRRTSFETPRSLRDLWWLASAVGYGRLLPDHEAVRSALPAAEELLRKVSDDLRDKLRKSLDWDGCLERLAGALKDTRPEELEAVLADSEELLAVAGALGDDAKAEVFCDEAEALIAWVPPEWAHLIDSAASRCRAFGDESDWTHRLWSAVGDAAIGAVLREQEPAVRPAPRLVDELIPEEPRWLQWRERAAALAENRSRAVGDWVRACLDRVTVLQPDPALGHAEAQPDPWQVHGYPASDAYYRRVFVVDDDYPDGWEVTEHFTEADGFLWRIDQADDRALIILIAAETPLAGASLDSVLADAAQRKDVSVQTRELQPTQVTNANC